MWSMQWICQYRKDSKKVFSALLVEINNRSSRSIKAMIKIRKFKTASHHGYTATTNEIEGILTTLENISLPTPFVKSHLNKWILSYTDVMDIIKNGKNLYYIVYSNCCGHHATAYAKIFYANSKEAVKEHVMKGYKAARGYGRGRCINCILEVSKMHPYEISKILNSVLPYKDKIDENRWYASYRKDYPGVMNPACIEEMCTEYEKKYGESVDAWKTI